MPAEPALGFPTHDFVEEVGSAMNVSSVGGAASLPVPLPVHLAPQAASTAASASSIAARSPGPGAATSAARPAGAVSGVSPAVSAASGATDAPAAGAGKDTGGIPAASSGDLRLPGAKATGESAGGAAAHHKEKPKPAPLPPLRGLTVAEFRAMLGAGVLPGSEAAAAQHGATPVTASVQAVVSRYA